MNKQLLNPRFIIITLMVLVAAALRLLPHYPNFTPIAGMALFGGGYFSNKKTAFIIPFTAMFISDIILGFHSTMWAVYLSFALIVIIGFSLQRSKKISNIFLASISSSVLFFIITNFGVWLTAGIYPVSINGLTECYIAAIPFFNNTMLGDLFYVTIFFGAFELAQSKFSALNEGRLSLEEMI
ncbi:MAG: DUF6580 family putative transport protein [Ignavibacteriaceae bacterium]